MSSILAVTTNLPVKRTTASAPNLFQPSTDVLYEDANTDRNALRRRERQQKLAFQPLNARWRSEFAIYCYSLLSAQPVAAISHSLGRVGWPHPVSFSTSSIVRQLIWHRIPTIRSRGEAFIELTYAIDRRCKNVRLVVLSRTEALGVLMRYKTNVRALTCPSSVPLHMHSQANFAIQIPSSQSAFPRVQTHPNPIVSSRSFAAIELPFQSFPMKPCTLLVRPTHPAAGRDRSPETSATRPGHVHRLQICNLVAISHPGHLIPTNLFQKYSCRIHKL